MESTNGRSKETLEFHPAKSPVEGEVAGPERAGNYRI
jgi:hypothetical protein